TATLYIWMRVPDGWDSERFASFLLEECGVSFAPGSFFGRGGEGYVRISITSPKERIAEAMERLSHLKL
ncbi:MAG: LL-diaminopimelate aminotransferase, partial [Chloroflexi bacterium]